MAAITICSDLGAQKNKVRHCFHCFPIYLPLPPPKRASLVVKMSKNLPTMQKTQVESLGHKDPLVKGMATHSSILA